MLFKFLRYINKLRRVNFNISNTFATSIRILFWLKKKKNPPPPPPRHNNENRDECF